MGRYHCHHHHLFFLFLLVRKGITSVGDLDPLTSKIINENSLFDSSDNNILSSLSPDGSGDDKLDFSNLNDAASNLAADDKTSSSLNLDSGDGLFFGGPDGTDSDFAATDDSLFNLGSQEMTLGSDFLASDNFNGGGSSSDDDVNFNPFLTADAMAKTPNNCNPNTNTNTNNENSQSLNRRRNRPRSSTLCSSSELQPPLPAPREGYLTPLPFLETDEEIKRFFCPAEVYQGILNIPVCAIYDDFGLLSSDVLSFSLRFIGSPLLSLGLMDVAVGRLMTEWNYLQCSENRAWCCYQFLPDTYQIPDLASIHGRGLFCAKRFIRGGGAFGRSTSSER